MKEPGVYFIHIYFHIECYLLSKLLCSRVGRNWEELQERKVVGQLSLNLPLAGVLAA